MLYDSTSLIFSIKTAANVVKLKSATLEIRLFAFPNVSSYTVFSLSQVWVCKVKIQVPDRSQIHDPPHMYLSCILTTDIMEISVRKLMSLTLDTGSKLFSSYTPSPYDHTQNRMYLVYPTMFSCRKYELPILPPTPPPPHTQRVIQNCEG